MTHSYVTEDHLPAHPDKVADLVAHIVALEYIKQGATCDIRAIICRDSTDQDYVIVFGEAGNTIDSNVLEGIVRKELAGLGYESSSGLSDDYTFQYLVRQQSGDIQKGLEVQGAGDTATAFGYATNETNWYLPIERVLAHDLVGILEDLRINPPEGTLLDRMRPDGKVKVTVLKKGNEFLGVSYVKIAKQHSHLSDEELPQYHKVLQEVVTQRLQKMGYILADTFEIKTNGTGVFEIGGVAADAGLRGEKAHCDLYGESYPTGCDPWWGEDPTKSDRLASFAARYVAKNIVAAGLADRVQVMIGYSIGQRDPDLIEVDTLGTGTVEDSVIRTIVEDIFSLSVPDVIRDLKLNDPVFYDRAFREGPWFVEDAPWEQVDKVDALQERLRDYTQQV